MISMFLNRVNNRRNKLYLIDTREIDILSLKLREIDILQIQKLKMKSFSRSCRRKLSKTISLAVCDIAFVIIL